MRCESEDVANRYLTMMYGEMPQITEVLQTMNRPRLHPSTAGKFRINIV
jgi:hypothetical protein